MRYSLSFMFCLMWLSSVHAQQPVIDYLQMDEAARTLLVHGSGFGTFGQVTVDNFLRPITLWSDTLLECSMPDSGAGFAGEVIVQNDQQKRATRMLSKIGIRAKYGYLYQHNYGNPGESDADTNVTFCIVRLDLKKMGHVCYCSRQSVFSLRSSKHVQWNGPWVFGWFDTRGDSAFRYSRSFPTSETYNASWVRRYSADSLELYVPQFRFGAKVKYTGIDSIKDSTCSIYSQAWGVITCKLDARDHVIPDSLSQWNTPNDKVDLWWYDSASTFPASVATPNRSLVELTVWPNPADKIIKISLRSPWESTSKVVVSDALGRKVMPKVVSHFEGGALLDTSELPNGEYFCAILGRAGSQVTRFVIAR